MIFNKWKVPELAGLLKQQNLYPYFRKIEKSTGGRVFCKGESKIMLGSNNYLGLTHDPRVIAAGKKALDEWGTGCTGSRFLNGNLSLHHQLEDELSDFLGFEDTLVFASGFLANLGAISTFAGRGDYILSDADNHACIIDGSRLSLAKKFNFRHRDMVDLKRVLNMLGEDSNALVITDGVFSMTGSIAPCNELRNLCDQHKAALYIDDAHGLGVIGKYGKGTPEFFGIRPDIYMGTFSKSLAAQGGFISGNRDMIDVLRHRARSFMFSAALSPSNTAIALQSLRILRDEPEIMDLLRENVNYLRQLYQDLGINNLGSITAVQPIFIGDDIKAMEASQMLLECGVFTTPVVAPAVPQGMALIRTSVMATHTHSDLEMAAERIRDVLQKLQISNTEDLLANDARLSHFLNSNA